MRLDPAPDADHGQLGVSASLSGRRPSRCSFSITWFVVVCRGVGDAGMLVRPASRAARRRRASKVRIHRPDCCRFGRTDIGCRTPRSRMVLASFCSALLSNSSGGGEVGVSLVGQQGVLIEGFGAATGLEQFFFGEKGDGGFAGGAAGAVRAYSMASSICPLAATTLAPRSGKARSGGGPWPAAPGVDRGGRP